MTTHATILWRGPTPTCDMKRHRSIAPASGHDHSITDSFVDGKTRFGSWACMCIHCFEDFGTGLGNDHGQMYRRQADGSWLRGA